MSDQPDPSTSTPMSRRRFLASAAASGALLPAVAAAQAPKLDAAALRPVVNAADLAITDEQLGKIAGAVNWGRGELKKLREVETGAGAPAPVFLPAEPAPKGGASHE